MACGPASFVTHNSEGVEALGMGSRTALEPTPSAFRVVPAVSWAKRSVSMHGPLITSLQSRLARQAGVRPGMLILVCICGCARLHLSTSCAPSLPLSLSHRCLRLLALWWSWWW